MSAVENVMDGVGEGDDDTGPGFFSLRSVHPSEIIGDDGSSYVFVDHPDTPSHAASPAVSRQLRKVSSISSAVWTWGLSLVLAGALFSLPFVTLALFVPIASIFAFPWLLLITGGTVPLPISSYTSGPLNQDGSPLGRIAIFYTVPSLSYLSLAQIAAPPSAPQPFLPTAKNYRLLLRVNLATFRWFRTALELFVTVGPEIVRTKLLYAIGRNWEGRVKTNIQFATRPNALLDVYLPKPAGSSDRLIQSSESPISPSTPGPSPASLSPIIIFLPSPSYGPIRIKKWMLASLGRNLARMGYCVVIPDIVAFGDPIEGTGGSLRERAEKEEEEGGREGRSRIKESVSELRGAMRWAWENGGRYGGDRERIYLAGHGLGAHLALLHVVQRAVVASREAVFQSYASASQAQNTNQGLGLGISTGTERPPPVIISNGTRRVREYGRGIWVPRVEGLILLSPICDVEKQVTKENELGISNLSTVRRALGPGQLPCIMHSPAHILHASRNILDISHLPKHIIFLHGGFDRVVQWGQSENMKELLRGVGVEDVKSRIYTTGHTGVVTGLMSHERGTLLGRHLENEIRLAAPL